MALYTLLSWSGSNRFWVHIDPKSFDALPTWGRTKNQKFLLRPMASHTLPTSNVSKRLWAHMGPKRFWKFCLASPKIRKKTARGAKKREKKKSMKSTVVTVFDHLQFKVGEIEHKIVQNKRIFCSYWTQTPFVIQNFCWVYTFSICFCDFFCFERGAFGENT